MLRERDRSPQPPLAAHRQGTHFHLCPCKASQLEPKIFFCKGESEATCSSSCGSLKGEEAGRQAGRPLPQLTSETNFRQRSLPRGPGCPSQSPPAPTSSLFPLGTTLHLHTCGSLQSPAWLTLRLVLSHCQTSSWDQTEAIKTLFRTKAFLLLPHPTLSSSAGQLHSPPHV